MKKRESLYLHALLALVREDLEDNRELTTGGFEEYETIDVCPTAVHRSKDVHERAVFALSEELSSLATRATDETERPSLETSQGTNQYAE